MSVKRSIVEFFHKYAINPIVRSRAGSPGHRYALLETIGRSSGEPRQTPVGNGLDGEVFWIVAEHGRAANYVRNLTVNPRVRVKANGSWRSGIAHVMPEDDPESRLRLLSARNAGEVRLMGTSLLSIRIDLDAAGPRASSPAAPSQVPQGGS